jgi:hypothetical protein
MYHEGKVTSVPGAPLEGDKKGIFLEKVGVVVGRLKGLPWIQVADVLEQMRDACNAMDHTWNLED